MEKSHHELQTAMLLADEARFEVARKMTEVRCMDGVLRSTVGSAL